MNSELRLSCHDQSKQLHENHCHCHCTCFDQPWHSNGSLQDLIKAPVKVRDFYTLQAVAVVVLITRAVQRFSLSVVSSLQNLKDLLIQKIFLHVFPLQTGTMREASEKTMERVDWCPWKLKVFNWKLIWWQMQLVATVKLVKSTTTKENYTAVKVNLCPFLSSIGINFYWPVH